MHWCQVSSLDIICQRILADAERSAFFIPFGQLVADSIGAGVQNMHGGWRLLCKLGIYAYLMIC